MDINKLIGHVPNRVITELPHVITTFGVDTPLRLSHFLSNAAVESGDFTKTSENTNYTAVELLKQWPKHFTPEEAALYAHQPIKIANRAYANRFGNGDEASGDGWKYRGRGDFETTFKDNYIALGKHVPEDIVKNPDLVAEKYALSSAGFFWMLHHLNLIADKGDSNSVCGELRMHVNGGAIGLDKVIEWFQRFYFILK